MRGEGGRIKVNEIAEGLEQSGCVTPDESVAQMLRALRIQSELNYEEVREAVVGSAGTRQDSANGGRGKLAFIFVMQVWIV